MHLAAGDGAVLITLDKNSERKREKGKGWAYVLLGMYDEVYDEDKCRLDNEPSSYEFYEMSSAGGDDFYWMMSSFKRIIKCQGLGFVSMLRVTVKRI
jgi:hypothetical protein